MIRRHHTFADAGALALAASILLAGLLSPVAAQAGPVAAAPVSAVQAEKGKSPVVDYVALGDSYAAGVGAGFNEDDACRQSSLSYPELLDLVKHVKLITDASCSGATTADVLGQLSSLKPNKDVDLVTVTVGANDLGGAGVVAACSVAFTSPECQNALNAAIALMTPPSAGVPSELGVRLATTFAAVAAAAPDATILVTGYALLFETPPTTDPNYAAIATINAATAALNATIEGAVLQVASTGVDIRYVDVADDFAGHGIGSVDPWFHASGPDAFHPTAEGHAEYAEVIGALADLG
ncbi:MAG: SGNH/GDSL hydrolase family protein [Mycetocola sp.]